MSSSILSIAPSLPTQKLTDLAATPNPAAPSLTTIGAQETAPQNLTRVPFPATGELPLIEAPEVPSGPNALAGVGRVPASFSKILDGFLQQVNTAQHQADDMVESLALGEPVDVHQVMLALNEASNAMQLTLQVRGKILDAYQEFMRMPF
jgi:flagellar hook-basal body complex protein FliE